jgi:hypothetical protein
VYCDDSEMAQLLYLQAASHDAGCIDKIRRWPEEGELSEFCARWAPIWTTTARGVYLDLTGTGRLIGYGLDGAACVCRDAPSRWGAVSGGLGRDPLVARLAGRLASSVPGRLLQVPEGSERAFLAPFSIMVLARRFPSQVARLRLLGVRTLGDLQIIPRALLSAIFGQEAVVLLDAAQGSLACDLSRARHHRPEGCLLVGASWRRPLAGSPFEQALRRALARRVMLLCGDGPGRWKSWTLRATWDGGKTAMSTDTGRRTDAWPAWLALVEDLWRRLPSRRTGLVALELRGVRDGRTAIQADLFFDEAQERRSAFIKSWRRLPGVPLSFASETLLHAWEIRWRTDGSLRDHLPR